MVCQIWDYGALGRANGDSSIVRLDQRTNGWRSRARRKTAILRRCCRPCSNPGRRSSWCLGRGRPISDRRLCRTLRALAEIRNAREAYKIRDLRQRLSRYHAYVDAAFWGWNDVWLDPAFASFNLREELARIRVPTLVLRGDDDRYGTHHQVEIAKDLCGCPLQTLIIPTCGHVPHRGQPEPTLNAIARFSRSVALPEDGPMPPKRD
jgi:pimeloyl-ACP methyl ester carboxylesterase